ncbi:hypothetical protein [Levilactobacillus andaensis]|uniref:hypothetical protein n=1 Tax=Levilactobacillus andaensis TaxID=2799570 RepID=UPI00194271E6|nr:hypothetical protein [Levilactobacillus andaensis]
MNKAALILGVAGMATTLGLGTVVGSASPLTGAVQYHKYHGTTTIKQNYRHFKLTSHQPNSNYKIIKVTSWKNAKLKAGSKVKIDLMANQGTQYNWYRIQSTAKHTTHRYWVYGQALSGK